jgi:hypothetical protein
MLRKLNSDSRKLNSGGAETTQEVLAEKSRWGKGKRKGIADCSRPDQTAADPRQAA